MRTTLNLDDDLVRDAKIRAIQERTTLSEMVERGLRQILEDQRGRAYKKLPTHAGGPRPGMDIIRISQLIEDVEGPLAGP